MSTATQGAIAAGHACTAAAGLEMLRLGGNAFDAAAAAVLAACVAEPGLTSLAGGGFLLAHTPQRNVLFDFFTQTPRRKRPIDQVDFFPVTVNFGKAVQDFHIGLGAIAVPGTIGGIYHVQQTLGRLPFSVVTEPAIHYAKTGVEVNAFQAYCFLILEPILLRDPAMRQVYAPTGVLAQQGDRL
ncbi:MAG TPA: gamma-glutamyltransferase, partial [Candidatus Obscuribacterales bacterium]